MTAKRIDDAKTDQMAELATQLIDLARAQVAQMSRGGEKPEALTATALSISTQALLVAEIAGRARADAIGPRARYVVTTDLLAMFAGVGQGVGFVAAGTSGDGQVGTHQPEMVMEAALAASEGIFQGADAFLKLHRGSKP